MFYLDKILISVMKALILLIEIQGYVLHLIIGDSTAWKNVFCSLVPGSFNLFELKFMSMR